jgi:hypothetical protein
MSKVLKAIAGAADKPLIIGENEIPCFVLENEKRVITQRGLIKALGMSRGTSSAKGGDRVVGFVEQSRFNDFISNELRVASKSPIKFRLPGGGEAFGYEATILVDICDMIIQAAKAGMLLKQQIHIAERAEVLFRGFAKVGIIALVDEATGYQAIREKNALYKILEAYISPTLLPWTKRFPDEFYKEMFRLNNWPYDPESVKRPGIIGTWTNELIYEQLPEGVLEELKHKTPKNRRLHQSLTPDVGHPHLSNQLAAVTAIMRLSSNWRKFMSNFARAFNTGQSELDFGDDD